MREYVIIIERGCMCTFTPLVFTVIAALIMCSRWHGSSGEGRGQMLRGIPAIETFQFMKCANQATGEKEEGRRLEGNGSARPGPDHLIWEAREGGISWIERMGRQ